MNLTTIMDIKSLLDNQEFPIDLEKYLLKVYVDTSSNKYWIRTVLKLQLQIIGLQQGKTGQELESFLEEKLDELDQQYEEWLTRSLPDDINDLYPEG